MSGQGAWQSSRVRTDLAVNTLHVRVDKSGLHVHSRFSLSALNLQLKLNQIVVKVIGCLIYIEVVVITSVGL